MEKVLFGFPLSGKPNVCSDWPTFALFSPITTSLWRRVNGMVCAVDFISKGPLFKALYLLLCEYFVVFLDFVLRCRSFTHP